MGPGEKGLIRGRGKKAGANMTMVTKLGQDAFGRIALDTMKSLHMDTDKIFLSSQDGTGTALIMVDENTSQNSIMVTSGACGKITPQDISSIEGSIKNSQFLLTQLKQTWTQWKRLYPSLTAVE